MTSPDSTQHSQPDVSLEATTPAQQPVSLPKNQQKNEEKRLAKLAKFQAKQAALAAAAAQKQQSSNDGTSAPKEGAAKKKPVSPLPGAEGSPSESTTSLLADPNFINTTPKGAKKDMSAPLAAGYNPQAVEAAWYEWWEACGYFQPALDTKGKTSDKGTYVIPIPPPNVTGSLHLGHALTNSIQDCLIRWNRMHGKTALYIPGADHAGIATQVVVEKKLMRDTGKSRHDLGREPFIEEVFKWKDEFQARIYSQLRRMGSSYDWTRAKFTMDPDLAEAVTEAFVRLYDDGVIYRANRLVNWCTVLKTALSNLEVENKELEGRTLLSVPDHDPKKKYEFGVLIAFKYQVENSDETITVATTRLETMLGDTAIAVHPSDKRYTHLHGRYVIHPFSNRRIPIIPDEYPDPEFGTGAVKITPAHDFNDYIVGTRNKLEFINIFTEDGKINEIGGPQFQGLKRFDARVVVLEALKAKGLYVGTEDNKMILPICGRSGNIVEPIMMPQWWVNCQDMAKEAIRVVKDGEINIQPALSEREWYRWLEQPQDWCISRQLWWGHRIPAYRVLVSGTAATSESGDEMWVVGRSVEEAKTRAVAKLPNVDPSTIELAQDEDVLDTWFSSGLWPFSTLGWPKATADLERFFPNTLLETGWDILFFWVARMVMLSLKLTGKVPFTHVFCHAMVRDAHGRKMSKSLGNVIDPLDVIEGITLEGLQKRLLTGNLPATEVEKAMNGQKQDFPTGIPMCGTDALRFALLAYTSGGRDINLDISRVDGYRKFCNKLWNATRFAMLKLGDQFVPSPLSETTLLSGKESLADLWILSRLNKAIADVNGSLASMNFMQATNAVYQFWLYDLCDVYLEICKPVIDGPDAVVRETAQKTLYLCLETGLKLVHPFMPFVSEELYQRLPRRVGDSCPSIMLASYPVEVPEWSNPKAEADYAIVTGLVHAARSLIVDYSVRNATMYLEPSTLEMEKLLQSEKTIVQALIKGCAHLNVLEHGAPVPVGCALYADAGCNVHLLVKGVVDFDAEIEKLQRKLVKSQDTLSSWRKKTEIEGYEVKIKAEVREINANKVKAYEAEVEAFSSAIANFSKLKLS